MDGDARVILVQMSAQPRDECIERVGLQLAFAAINLLDERLARP